MQASFLKPEKTHHALPAQHRPIGNYQTPLGEHVQAKRKVLIGGSLFTVWAIAIAFIAVATTVGNHPDGGGYTAAIETAVLGLVVSPVALAIGLVIISSFPKRLRQVAAPRPNPALQVERRLHALEQHATETNEIANDIHRLLQDHHVDQP